MSVVRASRFAIAAKAIAAAKAPLGTYFRMGEFLQDRQTGIDAGVIGINQLIRRQAG
jgi:hypothetical protein